ncbi:MAG: hypothetical protein HQ481_13555 [Alphaproteobacteria bacterium]|nr:hypothetical protein [Alphaproteobacteria bacterium]
MQAKAAAELSRLYARAVELQRAGKVGEALALAEPLAHRLPKHSGVLDLFGTLLFQAGAFPRAVQVLGLASRIEPTSAGLMNRLGSARRASGAVEPARRTLMRASALDPAMVEPWLNLSMVSAIVADVEGAFSAARRAAVARPGHPHLDLRLGVALLGLGCLDQARPRLLAAWRRSPADPEVCLHLGALERRCEDLSASFGWLKRGIVLGPNAREFYGNLLTDDEGVEGIDTSHWIARAVCLRPNDPRLWGNLSAELHRAADFPGALRAGRRAVILAPDQVAGLLNMIMAALVAPDWALARQANRWHRLIDPLDPQARFDYAELELSNGDLARGWAAYESRNDLPHARARVGLPARWSGPTGSDGPLLVVSEQGIGDEIIFNSCLVDLQEVEPRIVLEADRRLIPLFQRSFPTIEVVRRQLAEDGSGFDYTDLVARHGLRRCVFSGSLPALFRASRTDMTPQGGYLVADPERVTDWRARLAQLGPGRKVGIVWRSAKINRFRAAFHGVLSEWAPIFRVSDCVFINLMAVNYAEELAAARRDQGVVIHELGGIDLWMDLDDVAALMTALDVVVAARTSMCHLASAVGTPTLRLAHSFYRISDGRDLFFANQRPMLNRDEPLDVSVAAARAAGIVSNMDIPTP